MPFKSEEQRRGYWASQSGSIRIPISIFRESQNGFWAIIAKGGANKNSKQYGLPILSVSRDDALMLKNKNKFSSEKHGYDGVITLEEFRKLENSKAHNEYIEKRKQSVEKTKQKKFQLTEEDMDLETAKKTFDQLKSSRVHGFPFFKYTGLKPITDFLPDIALNAPRILQQ